MIRSMEAPDLDWVMDIWLEANRQGHPFIPDSYWVNHVPLVRELLPQAEVWVEETEGAIGGFIGIVEGGFVAGLFVAVDRQSSGIGKGLLEHCKARYPRLSLHVYADNDKAVRFYRNNGFTQSEEMVNEDTGHREYVMNWSRA
ncbi:MAG: GCN5-related N-acetyltransferase [Paenibacillaceae bacterium]|nr:GCN5-related N-acetyltransferase [Paenibacillaceae bacterium]